MSRALSSFNVLQLSTTAPTDGVLASAGLKEQRGHMAKRTAARKQVRKKTTSTEKDDRYQTAPQHGEGDAWGQAGACGRPTPLSTH